MKFSANCRLFFVCLAGAVYGFPGHAESVAVAPHGMVVTEQNLATEVGRAILQRGGNAVDAAVAIGYAEAVVYPCCGNIGGGGFMLIHRAGNRDFFLDFRETAPLAASAAMYLDPAGKPIPGASVYGWRAAGVPGTVMGLEAARERFGHLSRVMVMAPAIRLARDGFVLSENDARLIKAASRLADAPATAHLFRRPDGSPLLTGDRLIQPDLARTLENIAQHGPAAFYRGSLPRQIEAAATAGRGWLTGQDFARYRAVWRTPVHCRYRGYDVTSAAPPSSGGVALCEALNMLQGYDLKSLGYHSAAAIQRIAEAERHVFLDRDNALGDPDFIANPVAHLTDPGYAAAIRASIAPDRATASSSLPPGTGVLMNDEMDDFTTAVGQPNMFGLRQGARNAVAPGKRPLSSMAPTMVTRDGKLVLVLGSPNGSRIISVVLQTILNVVDYGMRIDQAVAASRIHEQYLPDFLYTEPNALPAATERDLQKMGYTLRQIPPFGAAEAIEAVGNRWIGANDPRSPLGSPLGY